MTLEVACERLEGLAPEWDLLQPECASDSIFLTPVWQRAWAQTGLAGREQRGPWAVRQEGTLLGIAPLRYEEGTILFAGDPNLMDYQDILARPGLERPIWSAVLDHVAGKEWRQVELTGVRADSPSATLVPELARARGWRVEATVWDVAPFFETPASWEEYVQGLSKKDRHELRRKFRRLESSGQVSYTVVDGRADALPQAVETFLDLMRQSREEKAHFLTEGREAFFGALAEALADAGHLRLFFLDLDGVRIAAALCFAYRDELLLYNSGYDPAYRSLSPGLLLKAWCIRYAIEHGYRRFDFLRGDEPYKYDLGGVDRSIYRFVLER